MFVARIFTLYPEFFPGPLGKGLYGKALDEKTKELIALGIAISTRCDPCIAYHVKALVRLKTSRKEFCEALKMISYMGGGPSISYSAKALEAYDQFSQ